ncbi:TetR/AcrR family transcriptional regulator [Microbacterium sp. ASV49]|uniref:Helix-turn-helix domain-containing protein n=1 Tax=Microbacterium candidum TaxID=3041922 RepID=A0ABT7MYB4_9MICO|nr:TetR/AcrR family transcriptional regulator [Microbacterium sp. ASV49]MDL9979450.1 helix-turn-helix domain-containing protein [Microbacterium sp. ASV49]
MVKPDVKRRYDASGRRAAAAQRRARIVDAARERFLADGYHATTIAEIAADADVSPETVYKAFGSRAGLVEAIWTSALTGESERPAEARSDDGARAARNPDELLAHWSRMATEVAPLAAPVYRLVRTAAVTDADAGLLLERIDAGRAERMMHNVAYLVEGGHLRQGLTAERARDILMVATADLSEAFVDRAGWEPADFADVLHRFLRAALLP